ncbi:MAG: hypothetical protein QOK37_339 [Thermoanaerobaculia bacterium]|jgi:hypothetical protein|nr:hypothetical protein [Thermoanaerobaculia bacterium]
MKSPTGANGPAAIAAMTLTVLLSACVSANVAPTVVSYNIAVERAQNEMLLLNVVRAAKWQPMYLTDVAKITGSIKRDLSATLAIPLGTANGDPAGAYTGGWGASYSISPSFEINTLNTQDFMKGFLLPVTPERFAYFWNLNWPPEFLLHLFVLQIDQMQSDGTTTVYYNHPRFESNDGNLEFREFSDRVTKLVAKNPHFASCDRASAVGPPLSKEDVKDLPQFLLSIAKEHGLEIAGKDSTWPYQLKRVDKELRLQYGDRPSESTAIQKCSEPLGGIGQSELTGMTISVVDSSPSELREPNATLHLRSPEDILYYIGQIVRLETYNQQVPEYALSKHGKAPYELVPIFVAFPPGRKDGKGKAYPTDKRTAVAVTDAEGDRYIIPAGPWPPAPFATFERITSTDQYLGTLDTVTPGMSNEVLSILTELIALHKSAKDFPTAGVFRQIGQ